MLTCIVSVVLLLSVPVRIGYEENYPASFTDSSGEPSGLYIELFNEIALKEGWEPEYVPDTWPELTRMLLNGEIDLIACMTRTEERERMFLFPREAVESGWSILLVKKSGSIQSLRDLNGMTVALVEQDIHSETLINLISDLEFSVDTLWCDNYRQGMEAVLNQRAAAVPVPKNIMLSPDFPGDLVPQGIVWSPIAASFAGNPENSARFIDAINRNLTAMKADSGSVYYALIDKWLSEPAELSVPLEFYILSAVLFLLFSAGIILTNRKLAKEVKRNRRALENSGSLAEIALAAGEAENLDQLCETIAELLRKNLKAENFYLAMHNPEDDTFTFPYIKDEKDESRVLHDPESFTAYIHRMGKPVMLNRSGILAMIDDPDIPVNAPEDEIPDQYIAVPMFAGDNSIGVIAFQSYQGEMFTENDLHFVTSISGHLAGAFLRMKAREEVVQSRNRHKMLIDFAPAAIFLLDCSGRITECNRQAAELTGVSEGDLRNRFLSEFVQDSDRKPLDPLSKHRSESPTHFSGSLLGKSGTIYSIDGLVNSYKDGENLSHFVTIADVTEKNMLQRDAMRNERLEAIGLLAGGIAHDFNNILTGIMGSLSLLHTAEDPSQKSMLLQSAESASRRARSLTGQLLTFARGGAPIRKSINTEGLLRDVSEFVLRGSSILLDCSVERGTWNLNVDAQQFSQVLQNIVTNARQSMNDQGKLCIRAGNRETHGEKLVHIEIEDTGPGIPPGIIDNVFDPYFTTRKDGHGLGLATTFSIIHRHGGTIKAVNGVNGGAVFSMLVPASLESSRHKEENLHAEEKNHSGRILLLEDDIMVAETAVTMLNRLGYSSDVSDQGEKAVELYREAYEKGRPYTAVITDLTIPGGFGGAEAVKQILRTNPEAVVIVSSGYAGNNIMANYESYGFRGVLLKPYTLSELSDALLSALG